jgi:hypothetical protein
MRSAAFVECGAVMAAAAGLCLLVQGLSEEALVWVLLLLRPGGTSEIYVGRSSFEVRLVAAELSFVRFVLLNMLCLILPLSEGVSRCCRSHTGTALECMHACSNSVQ